MGSVASKLYRDVPSSPTPGRARRHVAKAPGPGRHMRARDSGRDFGLRALNADGWLTERPIAHRGLHDPAGPAIENTLRAAEAAVEAGFAIECDVQMSADGQVFVFHDATLDRLTDATGRLTDKSATQIRNARIRGSGEPPPTF